MPLNIIFIQNQDLGPILNFSDILFISFMFSWMMRSSMKNSFFFKSIWSMNMV